MRKFILYTILFRFFLSANTYGQTNINSDTIRIKEVVISGQKNNPSAAAYKKLTIDSLIIKNYGHSTLAELLGRSSNIFIKSYGLGGSASPSFRGTGAGHTQILWNNVNINHPMLGQADLSLFPVGLIDDIEIYFGGASMESGNGGIGGTINLETKPKWRKETYVSSNSSAASFGRFNTLLKFRGGNSHFQTVSKLFLASYENNFPYINRDISAEPIPEIRKHSQLKQEAFIQELYHRNKRLTTSARIWYQSTSRNLPTSILTLQQNLNETQYDQSLRSHLQFDYEKGSSIYFVSGAFVYNKLDYKNIQASINSMNQSETSSLSSGVKFVVGNNIKMKAVLDDDFSYIRTNNYERNIARNTFMFTASGETNNNSRLISNFLVREIFNSSFLIPDFSLGFQYKLYEEKDQLIKTSISRNSKIPSLNDMYWLPGGNPDLHNEYAYQYEFGYILEQILMQHITLKFDISLFRNDIKDMIQWHPGEFSYWTAENIKNIKSSGLETSLSLDYRIDDLTMNFSSSYSYTKATTLSSYNSTDASYGKQLIYVPENMANFSFRFAYHNLYSTWNSSLTGIRYTTVDNNKYLPSYFMNDINTGIQFKHKEFSTDINISIDNLFDINYQTIAFFPQPGRSYTLKLLIQFLK